jgi:hypothetical protein
MGAFRDLQRTRTREYVATYKERKLRPKRKRASPTYKVKPVHLPARVYYTLDVDKVRTSMATAPRTPAGIARACAAGITGTPKPVHCWHIATRVCTAFRCKELTQPVQWELQAIYRENSFPCKSTG